MFIVQEPECNFMQGRFAMETVDSEDDVMMPQSQPALHSSQKHSSQQVCCGQHTLHITVHDMVCHLHRMLDQGMGRNRKLEEVKKKLQERNR